MNYKHNVLLVLVFAVFLLFTQCTSKEQDAEYKLQKLVHSINMQCPIHTDSIMQLDSCVVNGQNMTYLYTVANEELFDVELFEEIGVPTIKDRIKNNPDLDYFRKYDANLYYEYRNEDNKLIYKFAILNTEY